MKGEKNKLILVYILMIIVICLIILLTVTILNNTKKEKQETSIAKTAPTVDVNPYPEISNECTFNLTLAEYNGLNGPKCKNGYSRYNVNNLEINGKKLNIVVIYSDQNGKKEGLYINDKKYASKIINIANLKFGIYGDKLFTLNTNQDTNVLIFSNSAIKLYDLKETLENSKIKDPAVQNVDNTVTSKTIIPNSFIFNENGFTFKTKFIDSTNQVINGSTYQVKINGTEFSKPEFVSIK